MTEPTARELISWVEDSAGEELAARVEKVLAKCAELKARDKRTNFKGDGGISIALVERLLNGEDKP